MDYILKLKMDYILKLKMWINKSTMSTSANNQNLLQFDKKPKNKSKSSQSFAKKSSKQHSDFSEVNTKSIEGLTVEGRGITTTLQNIHIELAIYSVPEQNPTYDLKQVSLKTDRPQQDNALEKGENQSVINSHLQLLSLLKRRYQQFVKNHRKVKESQEQHYSLMDLDQYRNIKLFLIKVYNNQTTIRGQLYNEVNKELEDILNKYVAQQLKIMSEQDRNHYEYIAKSNRNLLQKKSCLIKGFRLSPLSIEDMFKADILSIIYKINKDYLKSYPQQTANIFTRKALQALFSLERCELDYYFKKYSLIDQELLTYISYDLVLKEFIFILSLLEVKIKISNYLFRAKSNRKFKEEIYSQFEKFQPEQDDQSQQLQNVEALKYLFSQIAFYFVPGKKIEDQPPFRKLQIYEQLQNIQTLPSQRQKTTTILRIHVEYNIILKELIEQFQKIKMNKRSTQLLSLQEQIQRCQWSNIKYNKIPQFLYQKTGKHFTDIQSYINSGYINLIRLYFNSAINRFKTVVHSFQILHRIQQQILQKRHIYVKKFQYSFQANKKDKQTNKRGDTKDQDGQIIQKDSICSLIIAVYNQKLIYSCFIKRRIDYFEYAIILKRGLSKKLQKYKNFNLVLDEFKLNQRFYFHAFKRLNTFFKINFNTQVYVTFSPQHFQLHMIIDAFLRAYLVQTCNHQHIVRVLKVFQENEKNECVYHEKRQSQMSANFRKNIVKALELCVFPENEKLKTMDEVKQLMNKLQMHIPDIRYIIRDAARTLLVFQAFYQEILHKCQQKGKKHELIALYANQITFMNKLFKYQNTKIDSLFPNQRMRILSKFLNIQLYKYQQETASQNFFEQWNRITIDVCDGNKDSISTDKTVFSKNFILSFVFDGKTGLKLVEQIDIIEDKIERIYQILISRLEETQEVYKFSKSKQLNLSKHVQYVQCQYNNPKNQLNAKKNNNSVNKEKIN